MTGGAADKASAPRVLVADDSRVNQKVVGAMLQGMGVACDVVGSGGEAIEASARAPYAAILMDCQMPGVDGYVATARIRAREGTGARTPIIAMTASASPADRQRCLAAGMDDCLPKPFTPDGLVEVLERWIGARVAPGRGEPSAPDGGGPLEAGVLADLHALGAAFARDSFRMFLGGTPGRIDALAAALAKGDGAAIKAAAHVLRGSCGMIGARRLAELCAEIEGRARTEAQGGMPALIEAVRTEYRSVASALDAEIARLG
ncbi:MAG TPA: response regulator [Vicinamibacteria bacterium]|nr:response regulator [Vicinamibacteria bacterium]